MANSAGQFDRMPDPAILVMAPQPFYQDRGTPIAVAHLLRGLSHHGYRVDLLTFPGGRDVAIPGVRVIRVRNPFYFRAIPIGFSFRKVILDFFMWLEMTRLLRTHRYVAVHAVEEAAFIAVLGRRSGVRVVYDMQSSLPEQLSARRPFGWQPVAALLRPCERWLLSRVDQVVCSAGLAAHVKAVAPHLPVCEWRYPPQPAESEHNGTSLRRQLGVPDAAPLVVYAGTFEPYQGIDELLRAVPAVLSDAPETRFVLVGADAKRLRRAKRQTEELGIQNQVSVIARQPRDIVPQYLAIADVLVVPRAYGHNIPLKLFDYYGAGKPIVASGDAVLRMTDAPKRVVRVEHSAHALATGLVRVLGERNGAFRAASPARVTADAVRRQAAFLAFVAALYRDVTPHANGGSRAAAAPTLRRVSVVIPARNEAAGIGATVRAVRAQGDTGVLLDIVVVDDGSTDATVLEAVAAGARVVQSAGQPGNPGAARNTGAAHALGDPIVFLDADCVPGRGWLDALLAAHDAGAQVVGGALAPAHDLAVLARCDYYGSAYLVHPWRAGGLVPNHPPANLSVRRAAFFSTTGFTQEPPVCDGHEELDWQAELRRAGIGIYFEPRAIVHHRNRDGLANLMRRNYRWAYSVIQSKAESGNARLSGIYRYPLLLVLGSLPLAILQTAFIVGCWLRAGRLAVLPMTPVLMVGRLAYAWGMSIGGLRWLRGRPAPAMRSSVLVR